MLQRLLSTFYAKKNSKHSLTNIFSELVNQVDLSKLENLDVIPWAMPIPYFGNSQQSRIATVGLNPSNMEFQDKNGDVLSGSSRRFHTLSSLKLDSWGDAKRKNFEDMVHSCDHYFKNNPYSIWFDKLDQIIDPLGVSFYNNVNCACHLDLVPYATFTKWGGLKTNHKSKLIDLSRESFLRILTESSFEIIILNGKSVIEAFSECTGISLELREEPKFTLPRRNGTPVVGYRCTCIIKKIEKRRLRKPLLVLGYNHNIQSSFGVTKNVQISIGKWIQSTGGEIV